MNEIKNRLKDMKAMDYVLLCIFLSVVLVVAIAPNVNAETETYKVNTPTNLQFTCTLNNAIPSASAVMNISIYYQNGSYLVNNKRTTSQTQGSFNYSLTFPEIADCYKVKMFCTDGTYSYSNEGCYKINYNGETISSQQTNIYIIALIFLVFIILGLGYIITLLPSQDARSESGEVMEIVQLKHLRKVLGMIIWGLGLSIIFIISNLGIAYLSSPMIGNFFFVLWRICFYVTLVGLPVYFCYIIYKVIKDEEFKKILERGGDLNSL